MLKLYVLNRHYNSPVAQILDLEEAEWVNLKRESNKRDRMVFLGPSFHEIMTRQVDQKWVVRACKVRPRPDGLRGAIDYLEPTTVILDLGTPVSEEVVSQDEIMSQMLGAETWQKLLPLYLEMLKRNTDT